MKKLKGILFIFMLSLMFSGCGNHKTAIDTPKEPVDNPVQETEKIIIKDSELSENITSMTEVTSYVGDVDADGADEMVVLSTEAERDKNGEFLWNDGQDWALYVVDKDRAYILVEEYVQAGNVYFEVSDFYMQQGAEPKISAFVTTGAGNSLMTFTFSDKDDGYIKETVYDTAMITEAGINKRFSSFPHITK